MNFPTELVSEFISRMDWKTTLLFSFTCKKFYALTRSEFHRKFNKFVINDFLSNSHKFLNKLDPTSLTLQELGNNPKFQLYLSSFWTAHNENELQEVIGLGVGWSIQQTNDQDKILMRVWSRFRNIGFLEDVACFDLNMYEGSTHPNTELPYGKVVTNAKKFALALKIFKETGLYRHLKTLNELTQKKNKNNPIDTVENSLKVPSLALLYDKKKSEIEWAIIPQRSNFKATLNLHSKAVAIKQRADPNAWILALAVHVFDVVSYAPELMKALSLDKHRNKEVNRSEHVDLLLDRFKFQKTNEESQFKILSLIHFLFRFLQKNSKEANSQSQEFLGEGDDDDEGFSLFD